MGIRDIASKFLATPKGYGAYRDLNGEYHYIPDAELLQTHFAMREFNTEGCHPYGVMLKLVNQLEAMRVALNAPIKITSGYRNPGVGQVGHDSHVAQCWHEPHADGLGADIVVPGKSYLQVAQAAYNAGFRRIEVIKGDSQKFTDLMGQGGHVHVDVYDGSGNTTAGTMYDSPASAGIPAYPWFAYGNVSQNGGYVTVGSWEELHAILQSH